MQSNSQIQKRRQRYDRCLMVLLCLVTIVVTQSGCQIFGRFRNRPIVTTPVAFSKTPSKEQLLNHLASQTEKVRQLQSDVRVSMAGVPTLRGTLAVEKPNRLRMNAGLLGVSELGIDVGSNDNVFWFWSKVAAPGQESGIFYARHDEYQNSALQRSIPIEPGWLIDALGILRFEKNDRVEGPFKRPQDGRLEIHVYRNVGVQPTVRVIVVDPQFGFVNQQTIYNADGKRLAYIDSIKHEHYAEHNVSLPSRIELTADAPDGTQLKLTVDAGRFKINSIYGDPDKLWSMPNPGDVRRFNLIHGPEGNQPQQSSPSGGSTSTDRTSQRLHDHRTSSNTNGRIDTPAYRLR